MVIATETFCIYLMPLKYPLKMVKVVDFMLSMVTAIKTIKVREQFFTKLTFKFFQVTYTQEPAIRADSFFKITKY